MQHEDETMEIGLHHDAKYPYLFWWGETIPGVISEGGGRRGKDAQSLLDRDIGEAVSQYFNRTLDANHSKLEGNTSGTFYSYFFPFPRCYTSILGEKRELVVTYVDDD